MRAPRAASCRPRRAAAADDAVDLEAEQGADDHGANHHRAGDQGPDDRGANHQRAGDEGPDDRRANHQRAHECRVRRARRAAALFGAVLSGLAAHGGLDDLPPAAEPLSTSAAGMLLVRDQQQYGAPRRIPGGKPR